MKRAIAGILVLFFAHFASAQVHPPINSPVFRAFDANGLPLAGGLLYTYAAGTSTPLATYADAGAVTANTNPVTLDPSGSAKIFLGFSSYKFVLYDKNSVLQWSIDNINGAPPTGAITTVFGRTGTVVAVTGDYTCSQVTGAVCSIPTIYYQTLAVNGITQSPQRGALNFKAGTGVSVSCADNSTTSQTDCTWAISGGTVTPRTCNSNGCYQIAADGTITQWGNTVSFGTGANSTSAVTFPYPFTSTANLSVQVSAAGVGAAASQNVGAHVVGSPTTSGFTAGLAAFVLNGGTGNALSGTNYVMWKATGN